MTKADLIPLGNRSVAVKLAFGVWVVVPTWNLDVALAMIRDGMIEPWTARAVQGLLGRGDSYVNVGANFGFYMALGAHLVGRSGRVFAVEANPLLLPYLMRTLYWSGYPDVIRLFSRAASDQDGRKITITFEPQFIGGGSVAQPVAALRDGQATLAEAWWENVDTRRFVRRDGRVIHTTGKALQRECTTARLDTLLRDEAKIDLLHMDIEGSEPAAVAGAEQLIRRSPNLSVILEWSPHYTLADPAIQLTRDMWSLFEALGYSWYRIRHEDFTKDLPVPRLSPIATQADLFALPHCDVLIAKDLRAHRTAWPSLLVPEGGTARPLGLWRRAAWQVDGLRRRLAVARSEHDERRRRSVPH